MSAYFLRSRKVLRENSDNTAPPVDENNSSVQRGKRKTSSCSSQSPRKRRRTEEEKEREEEQERSSCESARSVSSEDVTSEEQSSATVSEAEESTLSALEEKYVQQERLGAGGYGSVYAGYRRDDLLPVAIKHIPTDKVERTTVVVDGEEEEWPLEVALMAVVDEAGGVSVELLDWFELQDELVMVMERPVPCMDLMDYVQSRGGFLEEEEAKVILRQLVEGMIDIHSKGVLHRDIKPENILVQTDPEGPRARVLDFGSGCFIQEDPYSSYCGTPDYTPPEWFLRGSYQAEPCTVWQIGVTLYIMLTGWHLFSSPEEIANDDFRIPARLSQGTPDYTPPEWFLRGSYQAETCTVWQIGVTLYIMLTGWHLFSSPEEIANDDFRIPARLSQESEDLLDSCLEKRSGSRPSLQSILQHPWLQ